MDARLAWDAWEVTRLDWLRVLRRARLLGSGSVAIFLLFLGLSASSSRKTVLLVASWATFSSPGLDCWKLVTSSSTTQFRLNLISWSCSLHAGHFPSCDKYLRIHRLQNVCEQLVIIGVVKKSLHTWQRSEDSSGARAERGVGSQSVGSVISSEDAMMCPEVRKGT